VQLKFGSEYIAFLGLGFFGFGGGGDIEHINKLLVITAIELVNFRKLNHLSMVPDFSLHL